MSVALLTAEALFLDALRFKLVDARREHEYLDGHIPGAIWMGWEDWCDSSPVASNSILGRPGYWGVLRSAPDSWYAERLSGLGLSEDDDIVVYAGGVRSRGREGRIAWMLLYLGARSVFLLDGGWDAWLGAGGLSDISALTPAHGHFTVSRQPDRRCTLPDLAAADAKGGLPRLIDTRSAEEFAGRREAYLPRRGHLPAAVNAPFTDCFQSTDHYVDAHAHKRRLEELADVRGKRRGVGSRPTDVAYCEVGVRAALFALLHEIHTGEVMSVYDGSLIEWSLHPDLPLEFT
jgi:thiosulfate/3-mercaptopyruvate sulfurtransferase